MLKHLAAAALLAVAFHAAAQDKPQIPADPMPSLDEAKTAYAAGEIAHARKAADLASRSLALKQGQAIRDTLPKPFDGWTVSDGDTQSLSMIALDGGITVDRTYQNADGTDVRFELLADSLMVEQMSQLYTNPAMITAGGLKTETIGGEQAFIDPSSGQITFLIDKRTSLTVTGSATPELRRSYAENVNFAALKAIK